MTVIDFISDFKFFINVFLVSLCLIIINSAAVDFIRYSMCLCQPLNCAIMCIYIVDISATNPCAAVLCPEGTQCRVNAVNKVECVCNESCDRKYDPVCGSDGRTYDNQCALDVERCKRNNKLTVVCQGTCQKSKHLRLREKS